MRQYAMIAVSHTNIMQIYYKKGEYDGIYGSTYDDLLTAVEDHICELLERHQTNTEIIRDEFSGNA